MRLGLVLASCALLLGGGTSALAQAAICVMVPTVEGELAMSADLKGWRTSRPAVVEVVNVAPAVLYVTAPSNWAASPAKTPATTFGLSATFSGANLGQLLPGAGLVSGVLSAVGTTSASVSLSANGGSPFPGGAYAAEVTVTCAPR